MTKNRVVWPEYCSCSQLISLMRIDQPTKSMTHKTRFLLAAFLATCGAGVRAQTPPAAPTTAPSVSVTAIASVASNYMFRGQRLQGPSFQPTVEMAAGNLTLGVWGNFPLEDKVPGSSDPEIDPY